MIILDIETTGLYPAPPKGVPDYIVAIGVLTRDIMNVFSVPHLTLSEVPLETVEKSIMEIFCRWLDYQPESSTFITYNGKAFDIPFITSKLLSYDEKRFHDKADQLLSMENLDLMDYARFVSGRRMSKDDACRKLANLYVPRKSDGLWNARIYKNPFLVQENDHLEMLQHNATDLTATGRLYNVVKHFPDFSEWRKWEWKNNNAGKSEEYG